MILDKENLFSNAQVLTTTAASTNIIDLGTAKDHGPGNPLILLVQVVVTFAGLTSMAVVVQTDSAEGMGTVETLHTSAAIAAASLIAGYKYRVALPQEGLKRYLRLSYTISGTASGGSAVTAGIVPSLAKSFA